ncbi:right-handed parallel beta-helix repeat-containing protein [Phormidium sp. FACHB-592]|uniref:Right-handed parallel beta-helix repeat-containing protein n=1 Tax=Stenomitos frigidus AS-A4 TaxID=2933935 RepID=A0ABV0KEC8_9CYAN|nr:right-handed parallel beta-helix repeat-containing protein [Phormidium sp. FACHB-592]MBD2076199.1 right-handed parallel beta-helix repeat-containing protein [Phormidium sp. FACHB-592]
MTYSAGTWSTGTWSAAAYAAATWVVAETGRAFYVSATGNDTNDGLTPSTAWATIGRVNTAIVAGLQDGDRILFRGGDTFSAPDGISFDSPNTPRSTTPYRFDSYGTGKATIQTTAANSSPFYIYNRDVRISNLKLFQASYTTAGDAVNFYYENGSGYSGSGVINCDIDGCKNAIVFGGTPAFSNFTIEGCTITNVSTQGIISYADNPFTHKNITVRSNIINKLWGLGTTTPSASAIVLGGVVDALIEDNYADGNDSANGFACNLIWVYDAKRAIMQKNIAVNAKCQNTSPDGGAYGIDLNCIDCKIINNYAYNCRGEAALIIDGDGNSISGNIFVDCAKGSPLAGDSGFGTIYIYGGLNGESATNSTIINNTIVNRVNQTGGAPLPAIYNRLAVNTGLIAKNILVSTLTTLMAESPAAGLIFIDNQYYSTTGTVTFKWGGTTYTGLTNWRGTPAQEKIGATNYGQEGNPLFVNLSGTMATDFKLTAASPTATKTGIDLYGLYGIQAGLTDYFGTDISQKITSIGADSTLSVGARSATPGTPPVYVVTAADAAYVATKLPNVPTARRDRIATVANSVATAQSTTGRQIIDDLATAHRWWQAGADSTGVSVGTAVSAWTDWITGSNQWVQATAGSRPLLQTDTVAAGFRLSFDGVDDFLDGSNTANPLLPDSADFSFHVAVTRNSTTVDRRLLTQFIGGNATRYISQQTATNFAQSIGGTLTPTTAVVFSGSGILSSYRSGTTFTTIGTNNASTNSVRTTSVQQTGNIFGARTGGTTAYNAALTDFWNGYLHGLIVYRTHSATVQARIRAFMQSYNI